MRRRHFYCSDAEREAESRRRYPLPSVAQTLPEPLPLWMIGRIWCTRRSWQSRPSDTTVSWGGVGGLEVSDPPPPPTEAGNRRQNGGIVSEPGSGRVSGSRKWAAGPRGGGSLRPQGFDPSGVLSLQTLASQQAGVEGGGVGCKMAAEGGGRVPGRGRGGGDGGCLVPARNPHGSFGDRGGMWRTIGWGDVSSSTGRSGEGGIQGAVARAPFREIWRVGAVAFPRRPSVGRRPWSLTKEKPRERTASLGRWWGVVFGEGGVCRNHCGSSLGGGRRRCCDWIFSRRPAHLGVEGFGAFLPRLLPGRCRTSLMQRFVLTQDTPKFLRFCLFVCFSTFRSIEF